MAILHIQREFCAIFSAMQASDDVVIYARIVCWVNDSK